MANKEEDSGVVKETQPWGAIASAVLTVFIYFFSQFSALITLLLAASFLGHSDTSFESWSESTTGRFIFALTTGVILLGSLRVLLRIKHMKAADIGLIKPKLSDAGKAVVAYGAYFVILIIVTTTSKLLVPSLNLDQEQQIGFSPTSSGVELLLVGIALVIIPPIVEEILMRGFLFTGLRQKLSFWPAAVISGLIFGMAHLQFGSGAPLLWVAAIDTFVLALFLAYLRESTKSLASPIFLHTIKNALAFSLLFIFT